MKRLFDIFSSLYAIILFSPVLLLVSIAIKLESKGPIVFKQDRPGLENKLFKIYKFRSMRQDTPNVATDKLDPSDYITKTGKFIRKTSLDELPQLFNIVKGDMAVVGPRPALYNQYELIEKRTNVNVHLVKPGVNRFSSSHG